MSPSTGRIRWLLAAALACAVATAEEPQPPAEAKKPADAPVVGPTLEPPANADLNSAPVSPVPKIHQAGGHRFQMPDGFYIEQVAGPPLVERPIVADFDDRGRLYVAEASGTNDPVEKQLADKPHRVVQLVDTDGDGIYDERSVFAEHLMLPQGVMWLDGSLYVGAPPSIWKLTDTDDDGVVDERVEWFNGGTLTGCANDLHGPFRGPDGWIYWCKGGFAEQTIVTPSGQSLPSRAAHVFRARPDGTHVETVMTGGMDNPVELVFTPDGEMIFTSTFVEHPSSGRRDGLVHAVYGGVYGKVHSMLDGHVRTSPDVLPPMTQLGPAAPAGLVRFQSTEFGDEYENNLFVANFNLHKVTRHQLRPAGATYATLDSDFLVAEDVDFHPTDVLEHADGSLLVVDTGGWYKLCCPTSRLVKPDVLGGIYRVRANEPGHQSKPRSMSARRDPWGIDAVWEIKGVAEAPLRDDEERPVGEQAKKPQPKQINTEDAALTDKISWIRINLTSTRPRVRQQAADRLVALMKDDPWADPKFNSWSLPDVDAAAWAMSRIDDPAVRKAMRGMLADHYVVWRPTTAHIAIKACGMWRDKLAVPDLIKILLGEGLARKDNLARRKAAEALGHIGDASAVPALLEAVTTPDPFLSHSIIYALIEIASPDTAQGLASTDARIQSAALIALAQMRPSPLTVKQLEQALLSEDVDLQDNASWIVGLRTDWTDTLAARACQRLAAEDYHGTRFLAMVQLLAQLAGSAQVQQEIGDRLADVTTDAQQQRLLLAVIRRSPLDPTPASWLKGVQLMLASGDPLVLADAVETAKAARLPPRDSSGLRERLLKVGADTRRTPALRLAALSAVGNDMGELAPELFTYLRKNLHVDAQAANAHWQISTAVRLLASAWLSTEQQSALLTDLSELGPLELRQLLTAFHALKDKPLAERLLTALKALPTTQILSREDLEPVFRNFPEDLLPQARQLSVAPADMAAQQAQVDAALRRIPDGDQRRGQAVFYTRQAACSGCHKIGYVGGTIGPDLTKVGAIRTPGDLLESILIPSASFVRSYEPLRVVTHNGNVLDGLIRDDGPDAVTVITGPDRQQRVPRAEIAEMLPGKQSIMPTGLDKQLSDQQLADLVEFLLNCR